MLERSCPEHTGEFVFIPGCSNDELGAIFIGHRSERLARRRRRRRTTWLDVFGADWKTLTQYRD